MVRQALGVILAGLIVLNSPASIFARAKAGAGVTGDLSLASDPPDANVFVDGLLAGQTPVTVKSVSVGDHRVRFVKAGYLENARVVSVSASGPTTLQVRLTRQVESATAGTGQSQGAARSAQGGGGSKVPWLLVGVGGGFAGGVLGGRSKSSDAPSNRAPAAGSVAISPQAALVGTTVAFAMAGASDADGDPLTFDWNFGDNTAHGTGATATHAYTSAAGGSAGTTYTVNVTVVDSKGGTATATGTVLIKSLTGTWAGSLAGNQVFNTVLNLTQTGATIGGSYVDQLGGTGTVTGVVAASGVVTLSVTVTTQGVTNVPFNFTGAAGATIDTLTGAVNNSGFTNASWPQSRQ
jgi:hypothetical protein